MKRKGTSATAVRCVFRQPTWLAIASICVYATLNQVSACPTNLVLRGSWPESSGGAAEAVAVAGHYAYVANGTRGLEVLNVSDPAHPVRVGGYPTSGYADGICVVDCYVYLNASSGGTYVLNVTGPANPMSLGSLDRTGFFRRGQAVGDLLVLAAANMKVLNVSNPAVPTLVADVDIDGNALDVEVVGNQAYFAGDLWWSLYDISDPIHPEWVSTYEMPPFVNCIAAASNHAYVGQETTLHVFDLQDPAHPVAVGSQELNGTIGDMEIAGNALFVAHSEGGVSVFDISNPAHPVRATGYDTPGFANSVRVLGNYVFVADGPNGLLILEAQPLELPKLTITCVETNSLIRWPASALGFVLEVNSDLNTTNWFPVLAPPQVTGEGFSISRPLLGQEYFRLRRQQQAP